MPLLTKNEKTVLFIHIPKTAGTSIEDGFVNSGFAIRYLHAPSRGHGPDRAPCNPQHWHQDLLVKHVYSERAMWDYEFSITRNPFQRLISEMLWRQGSAQAIVDRDGYSDKFLTQFQAFCVRNMEQHLKNDSIYKHDKEKFYTLNKKFHADNHFRPQHEYVRKITRLYKYENLTTVIWPDLQQKFNLLDLPAKYITTKKHQRPVGINPTSEFKSLYLELYAEDHKRFNYPLPF